MALTQAQRQKRRERIAKHAGRHGVVMTAARFEVSPTTVRVACAQHGVEPVRSSPAVSYDLLARLINTDDPFQTVADDYGVRRQAVSKIARKCREAGIKIQPRK